MYKALVADDEEIIRSGIAKLLQKDEEIQVVALAEDGEMALQAATEHLPDLLLVDINMPFLNGLDFIQRLGDVLKNAVIIVITGYDDFEYARRALQLGVFDYLLKPLSEAAFYSAIQKAKEALARSRKQVQYLEWARLQLQKNRGILVSAFLDQWLEGSLSETEIQDRMHYLELKVPEQFAVTLLHVTEAELPQGPGQDWNDDLLFYAVENIAAEVLGEYAPVSTCKNSRGDLVLISAWDSGWDGVMHQLKLVLEQHLPVRALCACSCGEGLDSLPLVYEDAMQSLEQLGSESPMVAQAKLYIEEQFCEVDFSLQETAQHLHVSPQHLSRQFRRETGSTFMEYVTRCRIRRAMELLARDGKIYEVAQLTGYSSQHYFSSAFKKVLGVSPLEYRKELQHR